MKRTLLALLLLGCTAPDQDFDSRTRADSQEEKPPVVVEPWDEDQVLLASCRAALRIVEYDKSGARIERANLDVEAILAACPVIDRHLRFRSPAGEPRAFAEWSDEQRRTFVRQYQYQVLSGAAVPIACPDPRARMVEASVKAGYVSDVYFTAAEAFDLFAAHAAHVLTIEATGAVPWSILDRPEVELDVLLDASAYVAPIRPSAQTLPVGIVAGRDYQVPFSADATRGYTCDPHDGYRFLRGWTSSSGRDLVGATPEATLANLTLWLAQSMRHGPTETRDNALATFAFQLRDRLRPRLDFGYEGRAAAPAGCHSAAHALEDLARSVNIPLLNVALAEAVSIAHFGNRSHRALVYKFGTAAPLILEHTDDAYAMAVYPGLGFGPVPADTLYATVWRSKDELRAAGLTIFDDFPRVFPGVGFGVSDAGPYESRFDYGRLLGIWTDAMPVTGSRTWTSFNYRQQDAVCSTTLVEAYCVNLDAGLGGWLNFQRRMAGQIPYLADEAEARRVYDTTDACVTAAGGCLPARRTLESMRAQIDAVWVDF